MRIRISAQQLQQQGGAAPPLPPRHQRLQQPRPARGGAFAPKNKPSPQVTPPSPLCPHPASSAPGGRQGSGEGKRCLPEATSARSPSAARPRPHRSAGRGAARGGGCGGARRHKRQLRHGARPAPALGRTSHLGVPGRRGRIPTPLTSAGRGGGRGGAPRRKGGRSPHSPLPLAAAQCRARRSGVTHSAGQLRRLREPSRAAVEHERV